jgi:hypothetical protein
MSTARNRSLFIAATAAAVLVLVVGCGASTVVEERQGTTATVVDKVGRQDLPAVPESNGASLPWRTAGDVRSDADAWGRLKINANWVEFYPTLGETIAVVDFAGFANVVGIEPGDPIGDEPGGAIETVTLIMEIVDSVKATDETSTLRLRMGVPGLATSKEMASDLAPLLSSGTVFVALHRLESGDFRIINENSIWAIAKTGEGIEPVLTEFDGFSWKAYIDGYGDVSSMQEMHERLLAVK